MTDWAEKWLDNALILIWTKSDRIYWINMHEYGNMESISMMKYIPSPL